MQLKLVDALITVFSCLLQVRLGFYPRQRHSLAALGCELSLRTTSF